MGLRHVCVLGAGLILSSLSRGVAAHRQEYADIAAHSALALVGGGKGTQSSLSEGVAVPNVDRLTCLRQDDLDLAVPHTDAQVVRMVLGLGADTSSDIYVSVSDIFIKRLAAKVTLRRLGADRFYVEISGDDTYQGAKVASVDFKIRGCDVLMHSGWLNWAASQAADRKLLAQGQDGSLKFKITGTGQAQWNETSMDWDLVMTQQEAKPFQFQISNQYILQQALNSYGGIDQIIMNALWPAVLKAIPKSLVASFTMLGPDDLSPEIIVHATGSMPEGGSELSVRANVDVNFDTAPGKLLETLMQNFDPAAVAQKQMTSLLRSVDLETLWRENKPTLKAIFQRYGVKPEILEKPFDKDALDAYLLDAARKNGDMVTKALQPFINARKSGVDDLFEGLLVQNRFNGGWGADGLITASFSGPTEAQDGHSELLRLPAKFVKALSNVSNFAPPPAGQTSFLGHEALTFEGTELRVDRCKLKDMRVKTGGENGTAVKTWKLGGTVRNINLKLPASWNPGYKVLWDSSEVSLLPANDWVVTTGAEGIKVVQMPETPSELPAPQQQKSLFAPKTRTGDSATLDGHVPEEVARPTKDHVDMSRTSVMPTLESSANIDMTGTGSRLTLTLTAEATATIGLRSALQKVLAPRPQVDFGYIFFAGSFERQTVNGEETLQTPASVMAVVSCGYLRLLKPGWVPTGAESPLQRLNMDPKDGQLQIDLTQYTAAPAVEQTRDGSCAVLYSSGVPQRKGAYGGVGLTGRWYKDAEERLCGPAAAVQKLVDAIGLQVRRFRADPGLSTAWDYGTHNATEEGATQYPLPEGKETVTLTSIVDQ